jgi:hypothetical protein
MSLSTAAWTTVGVLLTVLAAILLIRRYRQGDVFCRWLAIAVVLFGAAFAAQGASAGDITPAVIQLTLTDLLALLALPLVVMGLLRMTLPGRVAGTAWLADCGRRTGPRTSVLASSPST